MRLQLRPGRLADIALRSLIPTHTSPKHFVARRRTPIHLDTTKRRGGHVPTSAGRIFGDISLEDFSLWAPVATCRSSRTEQFGLSKTSMANGSEPRRPGQTCAPMRPPPTFFTVCNKSPGPDGASPEHRGLYNSSLARVGALASAAAPRVGRVSLKYFTTIY